MRNWDSFWDVLFALPPSWDDWVNPSLILPWAQLSERSRGHCKLGLLRIVDETGWNSPKKKRSWQRWRANMVSWKIWMEVAWEPWKMHLKKCTGFRLEKADKARNRYFRNRILTFPSWYSKDPLYTRILFYLAVTRIILHQNKVTWYQMTQKGDTSTWWTPKGAFLKGFGNPSSLHSPLELWNSETVDRFSLGVGWWEKVAWSYI